MSEAADDWNHEKWEPVARVPRPSFEGELLPFESGGEFSESETLEFLTQAAEGYGPNMIGLGLGWSDARVRRFINHPDRAVIIAMITEAEHESVERAIMLHAKAGNATAMKLWAYNKMSHRGWADRREVRQTVSGQVELVASVRQALDEHTQQRVAEVGPAAIAELQAFLFDDEDDIVDAVVVEREGEE